MVCTSTATGEPTPELACFTVTLKLMVLAWVGGVVTWARNSPSVA